MQVKALMKWPISVIALPHFFENFRLLEDKENYYDKVFQKRTKFNRTKQQQILVNKLRVEFDEFLERRKGWANAS
jgi:hypothetical protein